MNAFDKPDEAWIAGPWIVHEKPGAFGAMADAHAFGAASLYLAIVHAVQALADYRAEHSRSPMTLAEQTEDGRLWAAYQDAQAAYLGTFDDRPGGVQ